MSQRTPRVAQRITRYRGRPGASPGTLHIDPEWPKPSIRILAYGPAGFVEQAVERVDEIPPLLEQWPVTWVNVDGLGDARILEEIGDLFRLHRLALEDVVNVVQRPKVDEYGRHLYVVMHMITRQAAVLRSEQVSIFLGERYVLTFQEQPGDCLEPIRERIRTKKQRIVKSGPDYLAYAVMDALIDGYFPVLESYGEHLDHLQEEILNHARPASMEAIYNAKRELVRFRRKIWPLRDLFRTITRDANPLITEETRTYLRDCADHSAQAIDLVESGREMSGSLMDLYISSVSNRMNEVMKVLTIFAALFIPLTFVAGIYGMNFDPSVSRWNMPELGWALGYPFALAIMGIVAVVMLVYFRRKKWL